VTDNQMILSILFGISMVVAAGSMVRGWLAKARLDGMREVVDTIIRNVSHHYERPGEPLPEEIEKAIDDLHAGVKRRKNDRERGDAYRVGAAVLLDKMGQAGVDRGFKSGQDWSEPRDGEYRIDMPIEHWRRIRYLAHIGFQHQMPNYERMLHFPFDSEEDALQSEAAIEKLEFAIGHSKSDPEYSDSLARNMLIWKRWPQEQKA
jgi:hypothetical protein